MRANGFAVEHMGCPGRDPLDGVPAQKEAPNKATVDIQGVRGQWHPRPKRSVVQQWAGARVFKRCADTVKIGVVIGESLFGSLLGHFS